VRAALHPRGVDAALRAVWPGGLPPRLDALVDRALCGARWADFKLGPILPLGGPPRPPRLALADAGEPEAWAAAVRAGWPAAAAFVGEGPPGARRMLDSDGGESAEVLLDDLQEVAHGFGAAPGGRVLMARALRLPSGDETRWSRHPDGIADVEGLPAAALGWARGLRAAGAAGLWAVRWRGDAPVGLLWVSESRWRGDAAATAALVDGGAGGSPADGAWARLGAVMRARGWQVYPDSLEWRGDGGVDCTVGFVPVAGPAGRGAPGE